jgi:hypothetical protein
LELKGKYQLLFWSSCSARILTRTSGRKKKLTDKTKKERNNEWKERKRGGKIKSSRFIRPKLRTVRSPCSCCSQWGKWCKRNWDISLSHMWERLTCFSVTHICSFYPSFLPSSTHTHTHTHVFINKTAASG